MFGQNSQDFEFPMKAATYRSNGGIMSKVFVFGYARPFLCDLRPTPPAIGYRRPVGRSENPLGQLVICGGHNLPHWFE